MATAANLNDVQPAGFFTRTLADADAAVAAAIGEELTREQTQIELIASENIVSRAVLEAQGSVFTNKYAEGYPGRRYYQGCHPSDLVEQLASITAPLACAPECGWTLTKPHPNNCFARSIASCSTRSDGWHP